MQTWTSKQCRTYHRVKSGLLLASSLGENVRFITVTSAPGMSRLSEDFGVLVKRIRNRFGRFEYIKVKTNEGHGVIHVLYRGSYIPQKWLSDAWGFIHGSPVVDIRAVRPFKGMASYIVSQYVSCQKSSYQRSSSSWNWIYHGWLKNWNLIRCGVRDKLKRRDVWESHLKGFMVKIFDRGIHRFLSPYPILNTMGTEQTFIEKLFLSNTTPVYYERLFARCAWLHE